MFIVYLSGAQHKSESLRGLAKMLKSPTEKLKRTSGLTVEIYGQIILFIILPFMFFNNLDIYI